jgi:anaerobic selenocysteine-containing dehydrogenase
MSETKLHTCMLCEAMCGLAFEVDGDRATTVRGDRDDPFSAGHICPKAAAIEDVRTDPDRLRAPLRRTRGGSFERVTWSAAIDEAADRIAAIQDAHGRDAAAIYVGNPMAHTYTGLFGALLLIESLGTRARFSATSVDQLPHMLASLEMFGSQALLPVPDLDRTDYLLVLGANPVVSNGSVMTAAGVETRLRKIRERGGKIVVVDPRRTETARIADAHCFIEPGTDALLLLAIVRTIFDEKLTRLDRLAAFTDGVSSLDRASAPFTPEAVAHATGIEATTIRELARDYARANRAACYGRVGICTQDFGGVCAWLVLALDVLTGNLDRAGGKMFATPAIDLARLAPLAGMKGSFATYKSRVRGLPEFGRELPVAALAEEIETPGEGQIRALVTLAGNPVLSTPNGRRLDGALAKLDFMLSLDIYLNETTRHAHLVLPTSFGTERDHFDVIFNAVAVRNTARYALPIFTPAGDVRHDWEILSDLVAKLGTRGRSARRFAAGVAARAMRATGARGMLDALLRTGPHRLSLRALEREPHGMDLGPLQPRLPALLATPKKRIDLAPALFTNDLARVRTLLKTDADARLAGDGALRLIGRRQLRSNNSWMHNSHRLVKGRERCTLLMHPDDARARGLASGASVVVRSAAGEVRAPLEITDDIARGVVSLPHGWGHHRDGARMDVARAHAGASLNDITDESRVDALSATASFSGVPVTVSPAR